MTFTLTAPLNATEGALYSFDITRDTAVDAVTIRWEIVISQGVALTSADFSPTIGEVDFAIGDTEKTVTFTVTNDAIREASQDFEVHIYNNDDDTLLDTQTVTLDDNDGLVRASVAAGAGEAVVLDTTHLLVTGVDGTDAADDLTYTVTDADASTGVLQLRTATNPDVWTDLTTTAGSNTFTQANLDAGNVRFVANDGSDRSDATFTLSIPDGSTSAIEVILTADIRVDTILADADAANIVEVQNETQAQNIETGDGQDIITDGQGNDRIEAGLGDDEIKLTSGGADEVVFRFGANGVAS